LILRKQARRSRGTMDAFPADKAATCCHRDPMISEPTNRYSFGRNVSLPFDLAVQRVTEELAKVGFGVLTDIDVQATMKKKLGLEMPPYRILGACNPGFASRAIAAEPAIGALLPCNVVVRTLPDNEVRIEAMDPQAVMQLVDHPDVAGLATDVRRLITGAIDAV
jgi:uncharacterized protein (DUF302 family)